MTLAGLCLGKKVLNGLVKKSQLRFRYKASFVVVVAKVERENIKSKVKSVKTRK